MTCPFMNIRWDAWHTVAIRVENPIQPEKPMSKVGPIDGGGQ